MLKILNIVRKNLKLLMRSKTSALIVVLGPLFVILLVGFAFNTSNLYNIRIGVYSEGYSDLTNSILNKLTEDQFLVTKTESKNYCTEAIKTGEYHVCAVFPTGMAIKEDVSNNIVFYVDNSRVNLVWIILDSISKGIETKATELGMQMTQRLLDAIKKTEIEVTEKKSLITGLASSSEESSTKIQEIYDELANLDLSFNESELDFEAIESEIDSLEESSNTSSDAESLLADLKSKVGNLSSKLSAASSLQEIAKTDLASVKQTLTGNIEKAQSIKGSMESISGEISAIEVRKAESIVTPITSSIEPVATEKTHLSFMFPTLLILVIMFICILLSSTVVIREKTSKAHFRNFITPTSGYLFIFGNYLTTVLIIFVQLIIIFSVALIFFKGDILSTVGNVLIALIVVSTVFILLGMLVGYSFKSEETASLGAISIASIFLFFSNTILPIESMPSYITNIAKFNPFIIATDLVKKLFLFKAELTSVSNSFGMLAAYILLFGALIWVGFVVSKSTRKIKRHFAERKDYLKEQAEKKGEKIEEKKVKEKSGKGRLFSKGSVSNFFRGLIRNT